MNILGINHSIDAAAVLVQGGRVAAACAEERFSRRKHDAGFPLRALSFALEGMGGQLAACDAVAFFWNPVLHMDAAHGRLTASPRSHLEYLYSLPNNLLAGQDLSGTPYVELKIPRAGADPLRIFYVSHHLCHGAHAFFESPFDQAAILTVDGYGERTSTLIARGQGSEITPELEIPFPHSIGSVYAAITQYLGFSPNSGEGKVMGLAAFGDPRYLELFSQLLRPTADGFEVDLAYFSYMMDSRRRYSQKLVEALGAPRDPEGHGAAPPGRGRLSASSGGGGAGAPGSAGAGANRAAADLHGRGGDPQLPGQPAHRVGGGVRVLFLPARLQRRGHLGGRRALCEPRAPR